MAQMQLPWTDGAMQVVRGEKSLSGELSTLDRRSPRSRGFKKEMHGTYMGEKVLQ